MIYKTFKEVLDDVLDMKIPVEEDNAAHAKWLGKLADVYLKALNNPPEGVVGVGAVTYAEQYLVEYQEGYNILYK